MADDGGGRKALRVGVRFEKVSTSARAELDRFVFAMMKRKASALAPQHERRMAPRVEIVNERLFVEVIPDRLIGALAGGKRDEQNPRYKVHDISTTGCSFLCDERRYRRRQMIRLRLVGEGLDLELQAQVVHARTPTLVHPPESMR